MTDYLAVYWRGLGAAMIPLRGIRRITLLHILGRIHRDIVRVWNMIVRTYNPVILEVR